jgi:mRNA interferase RelE/StbE
MAWTIELSSLARKNLDQLDPQIARRILAFLNERIARLDDPRGIGEALTGARLGEFWKYRVGDYRVISRIEDDRVKILVVRIGHRRQVYK